MNVPATMLAGATGRDFEHLATKPIGLAVRLVLNSVGVDLSSPESSMGAMERMHALATAAVRLGASHVSVALKADNDETSWRVASILREVMAEVEQHELTLMLSPRRAHR